MRTRARAFFILFCTQVLTLVGLLVHAVGPDRADAPAMREQRALVQHLQLTDLCLFTEARYTRHPSQADLSTPFQDHPVSLEHFPSGSFLPAPVSIRRVDVALD